jgi:hypothetical protein
MSTKVQGGTVVFDVAIDGVSEAAKDLAKLGASMATQGARIKKEIEATTDGFDDFRNSVDATLDTIRIFGRGSSQMADAIEDNIRDPALRAKLALEQLQKESSRTAQMKRKMADQVGLAKLRFFEFAGGVERGEAMLGGFKTMALAAGAAVVGGLVASVKLGIESNAKLKSSFDGVITQGKVVAATFGQILIGGTQAKEGADKATQGLKDLEKWMKDNATGIRDTVLDMTQGVLTAVKYIGMIPLGIMALFEGIGTAIGTFAAFVVGEGLGNLVAGFDVFLAGLADTLETTIKYLPADAADAVFDVVTELRNGSMAAAQSSAELRSMFSVKESDWLAGFQVGSDRIDAFTSSLDGLDAQLEQMKGQKIDIAVDRSALGGPKAAAGSDADRKRRIDELVDEFRPRFSFAAQTITNVDERVEVLADMNKALAEGQILGENFAIAMSKADIASAALAEKGASLLAASIGESINLMVDLGKVTAETLGEFAAGVGTLSEFGDAVTDMFGGLASSLGDFYIKTGLASIWLNPAAGAGMIAGGLALKALGGYMGAKGSGNRGGGGGRGASAGGAFSAPTPMMREERETASETYLQITILGDEVEGGLVRQLDAAARRGMFRNIQTSR